MQHQTDKVAIEKVEGLAEALNKKGSASAVSELLQRTQPATTTTPGLMSAQDKQKLDSIPQGGGGTDTFAEAFAALTLDGGIIRMGDNLLVLPGIGAPSVLSEIRWGTLWPLALNTHMDGPYAMIEDNHFTSQDVNYMSNELYSHDTDFNLGETQTGQDEYAFTCMNGTDIVIKSAHPVYVFKVRVRAASGTGTDITIADEDGVLSLDATVTADFTEYTLDYGNTPLPQSKEIVITAAAGTKLYLLVQPLIKISAGQ